MLRSLCRGNLRGVGLLPDYSCQGERYDESRAASPSVVRALREALDGAPGRRLIDIGGGTGNYALALRAQGWEPIVVDRSPEMLARPPPRGWRPSSLMRNGCRSRTGASTPR
jgi:SAM-dependent methyltransferase